MIAPAYHLRPNKAVERLTLVDVIKRITTPQNIGQYTYYGLGGPYLEDFRLFYELYPEIKLVSIEIDENVYKRQRFHLPCGTARLKLQNTPLSSFLATYEAKDEKSIFWLDYTNLSYSNIDEFMGLLGTVGADSVVKLSLRCNPSDYLDTKKSQVFEKIFESVLPAPLGAVPTQIEGFAALLQSMLQIAASKALPADVSNMFLPISSFCYLDSCGMFTLTGVVCARKKEKRFRKLFERWQFANLDWGKPIRIDVPHLSTKERLHLQRHLPGGKNAGAKLAKALGYLLDDSKGRSESALQQYADFHRYFPYFLKATP